MSEVIKRELSELTERENALKTELQGIAKRRTQLADEMERGEVVLKRSEMTTKQKSDFVALYGQEKFLELPA